MPPQKISQALLDKAEMILDETKAPMSDRALGLALGVSKNTANKVKLLLAPRCTNARHAKGGRPRLLVPRDENQIARMALTRGAPTFRAIAAEVKDVHEVAV